MYDVVVKRTDTFAKEIDPVYNRIRANTIYAMVAAHDAIYRGTTNDLSFEIYDEFPAQSC